MRNILVVYGSTTGNTEFVAKIIAQNIKGDVTLKNIIDVNPNDIHDADLVLLGSSTWGLGELQLDFQNNIDKFVKTEILSNKMISVFGCGCESGGENQYCKAVDIIEEEVEEAGGILIRESLKINDIPADSIDQIIEYAQSFQ